jgi:hypothetical protein
MNNSNPGENKQALPSCKVVLLGETGKNFKNNLKVLVRLALFQDTQQIHFHLIVCLLQGQVMLQRL